MVGRHAFTNNNRVRFLVNGDDYVQACLELINEAKEKIIFQMYIFEEDLVSRPVVDALIKRSEEGVKVFFLLDAFGSPELSSELKERFARSGVHFSWFSPLLSRKFEHIGRRLHQKVLIADNQKAVTGGMNLAKKFIKPEGDKPWLDYGVLIEGEEVYRLQRKCLSLYLRNFPGQRDYLKSSLRKQVFSFTSPLPARTVVNDFMRFRTEIYQSYLRNLSGAKDSVKITATYFLPGKRMLKELKRAAQRGVKIELIFGERSDHSLERWSSRYLYSWYLKHGLEVYEWGESILHAKAAVIDGNWVSIGSYNHNYISRYACLELNVEISDKSFASQVDGEFEKVKRNSKKISRSEWSKGNRPGRAILYFLSYSLANVLTFLSLLFVFRSKDETESL